eukprot:gene11418-11565_t
MGYWHHLHACLFDAAQTKVISYGVTFPGAAVGPLTERQVLQLQKNPNIASVVPNRSLKQATISTPDFLDLTAPGGAWSAVGGVDSSGENVTIGVIDGGFWPELDAFSDRKGFNSNGTGDYAYGLPPGTFKGICQPGFDPVEAPCNRKVIGCRWYTAGFGGNDAIRDQYPDEPLSCRSRDAHGTHTASTAGGNHAYGCGSNILPGKATMSGIAPRARLVIYKVSYGGTASTADVVSAIEDAVLDGVDIISYSMGSSFLYATVEDPTLLAYKNAAGAGIFVSAAAGNDGFYDNMMGTTNNNAPWLTQVADSSHNRKDTDDRVMLLGDGRNITGLGFSTTPMGPLPVFLGHQAALPGADVAEAKRCANGTLDPAKANGSIIACDVPEGFGSTSDDLHRSLEVKRAGGLAMLLLATPEGIWFPWGDRRAVPTVWFDADTSTNIREYAATTNNATAALLGVPILDLTETAPVISYYSSRGPPTVDYDLAGVVLGRQLDVS